MKIQQTLTIDISLQEVKDMVRKIVEQQAAAVPTGALGIQFRDESGKVLRVHHARVTIYPPDEPT